MDRTGKLEGFRFPLARQGLVELFEEATSALLQTAINDWLADGGEFRLLEPIVARSDGSVWYATAHYSE